MDGIAFCSNCGAKLDASDLKCSKCGSLFNVDFDVDAHYLKSMLDEYMNNHADENEKEFLARMIRNNIEMLGVKNLGDFRTLIQKIKKNNTGRGKRKRERLLKELTITLEESGIYG